MFKLILFCLTIITLIAFTSSFAGIIYIPNDTTSIQGGIHLTGNGDTVLVADGTYLENINFKGKAITVASLFIMDGDTNHINNTIIDGSQPSNPDSGSVVTIENGGDSSAVLLGFTVTNGYHRYGGGIHCKNSAVRFSHIKVQSNKTPYGHGHTFYGSGGGIYFENSNAILDSVIIKNNNAASGGGISCHNSSLIMKNSMVQSDTAHGTAFVCEENPGTGGGLEFINCDSVILDNVIITDNFSLSYGYLHGFAGGIYSHNSHIKLNNVSISRNGAGSGGGIGFCGWEGVDSSIIEFSNVTINHNLAEWDGGGISVYSYNIQPHIRLYFDSLNRSNIYQNSANNYGKDLYSNCDTVIAVIVDTFTVLPPDCLHACPLDKFTFDIQHALTNISEINTNIPIKYALSQNYPNPFNPTTTIEFDLPKSSEVTLKVFNILGEEVATLVSDRLSAGSYSYEWDASNLASGVYLYHLEAEGFVKTRKMILIK